MAREIPQAGPSRNRGRPGNPRAVSPDSAGGMEEDDDLMSLPPSQVSQRERGREYRGSHGDSQSPNKRRRLPKTLENMFEKQSAQEKREIGIELRALQKTTDDMQANLANATINHLEKQMTEANKLFRRVKDTDNGALDARVLLAQTEIMSSIARRNRVDTNAFDVDNFILRIKDLLGLSAPLPSTNDNDRDDDEDDPDGLDLDELDDDDETAAAEARVRRRQQAGVGIGDWERIGWMAAKWQRRVPGVEFMFGPLAREYKKRNVGQRQPRAALAPEQKPLEVVPESKEKVDNTMGKVMEIGKLLHKLDPDSTGLNFFPFVINPQSFGQSVENIFFVSFLIRDGRAGMHVEDDGTLMITHRQPPDEDEVAAARAEAEAGGGGGSGEAEVGIAGTNQGVLQFDHETWESAIELYDIKTNTIRHRPDSEQDPNGYNRLIKMRQSRSGR